MSAVQKKKRDDYDIKKGEPTFFALIMWIERKTIKNGNCAVLSTGSGRIGAGYAVHLVRKALRQPQGLRAPAGGGSRAREPRPKL